MNNSENRTMWGGMMEDLVTGIEHLKKAKAHMSKANTIMSDSISKLKALEEENARLKAELDDWKGNAEGFQPDAYMKLPLDADGEPIRVGDVLYSSGNEFRVVNIIVNANEVCVDVYADDGKFCPLVSPKHLSHKNPEPLESEPADSWEKLEEDAMGRACELAGSGHLRCADCKWGEEGIGCQAMARLEILKRAKKLAGIEGEAQQ